jgi:hypothetical protein
MIMKLRSIFLAGMALFLTACASIEGVYLPACEAYAGSKIMLSDGRFQWSKFTDQVVVDDDGNEVNQFPGFPLEGQYSVSAQVVTLTPDSGQPVETLYLHNEAGAIYLLTARENAAVEAGDARPECALERQSPGT